MFGVSGSINRAAPLYIMMQTENLAIRLKDNFYEFKQPSTWLGYKFG